MRLSNRWDGGERMQFENADAWLKRPAMTRYRMVTESLLFRIAFAVVAIGYWVWLYSMS